LIYAATFFKPTADLNPVVIEGEGNYLKALNKRGEELWKKEIDVMVRGSSETGFTRLTGESFLSRFLLIDDIDGDGRNETLLTGVPGQLAPNTFFSSESLYCLDYRGELRWSIGYPENIFAEKFDFVRNTEWNVSDFVVLHRQDQPSRLFVCVGSYAYYPAKLLEVDWRTGKVLQTYWHSGNISPYCTVFFDVDGDGNQEIVTGGVNNGFKSSFIAALDPDELNGCAPAPPDFAPTGIPRAREKYYILLPQSDISERFGRIPYSCLRSLSMVDTGILRVVCNEFINSPTPLSGAIHYEVGRGMKLLSATWDDPFLKTYNTLLKEGKVSEPLSPAYWQRLISQAQYWDGEKSRFVSYNELMRKSGMP
jgi:hypothetical protein